MRNRVLIADADAALAESYREYLLRTGFDVLTARDGLDCVAKLRRFVPDALVLSPDLPWGQGEGVLAMMYEEADVPIVPVLLLSEQQEPREGFGVGVFPVHSYQVKPVPAPVLAYGLRRVLARGPAVTAYGPSSVEGFCAGEQAGGCS